MFDIIGYWGILTLTLMMPVVAALWFFCCMTNERVRELGGAPIPLFVKFDKTLERCIYGMPVVIGCIASAIVSVIWAVVTFSDKTELSFIGWHSAFSEAISPVSGFVLAAIALMVAYDMGLRAYIRVSKLVNKLEEKAE